MRIEALRALVAVVWLTAVLYTRLVAAHNHTLSVYSRKSSHSDHHMAGSLPAWSLEEGTSTPRTWMTIVEMQNLIREEATRDSGADCCPAVEEMVEPEGGRNREDMYVELFRMGDTAQRFFEYSCLPEVLDKPCRFIDRKLARQSRCVQKFSYSYAIVENPLPQESERSRHRHRSHHFPAFPNVTEGSRWTLDYIKVRSGCSCELFPKPKKQNTKKLAAMRAKRTRSRSRTHELHHFADQSEENGEI